MKKSLSCPSFSKLHNSQNITPIIKRNISIESLTNMDNSSIVELISTELQFVSMKVPINKILSCTISSFPSGILTDEDKKNIAECILEPDEINCKNTSRYYWLEKTLDQSQLQARYFNFLSRIRKKNIAQKKLLNE
jgi:hypothetical protein